MNAHAPNSAPEHRLSLSELVDALIAGGQVPREEAEAFRQERRYYRGERHPLCVIAEQHWKELQPPHRVLDLDTLTAWLAEWSGLDYYHIDPLKVNLSAVTDVVSSAYATRLLQNADQVEIIHAVGGG